MYSKQEVVHRLANTELFTRSKIAELTGLSVSEVREILKTPLPSLIDVFTRPECIYRYCPHLKHCQEKCLKPQQGDSDED